MSDGRGETTSKLIKTIILGRVSVGKSSLLLKYARGDNTQQPQTTVGIDILTRRATHQGQTYSLQLWDTAGHERYRTVVYNYFCHAQAAVVVFDLEDVSSLEEARVWLQQLTLYCGENIPTMLLGNKSDKLEGEALGRTLQAYKERIEELKKEFGCEFYPVSAATGHNLESSFNALIGKAVQQIGLGELAMTIKLHSPIQVEQLVSKRKRRCC